MLLIVAIIMLLIMAFFLIRGKVIPCVVLTILPIIGALVVGTSFSDTMKYIAEGIINVLPVVALFIFSITYFGVMSDVGLFDPIIQFLVKRIGKSIYSVLAITALLTLVAHLDGSGVATLLIVVPAMLPVYKALKIRIQPLALTVSLCIAVMNMVPWGGPTARAAAVINMDPSVLWHQMIPIQLAGIALIFIALIFIARLEKRKGGFDKDVDIHAKFQELSEEEKALKRPELWWFNFIITIIVLAALFVGVPSFIAFLVGCAIILPLNFRTRKEQDGRIKAHAKNILPMVVTIISAGALLGVLEGTGMVEALANGILAVVPDSMKSIMHILIGLLIAPISVLLDADTIMYGVLPVVVQAVGSVGISGASVASMFIIGHNFGIPVCMTSAAVYFGLGIYGMEYKDMFKYNIAWLMGIGTLLVLLSGLIIG